MLQSQSQFTPHARGSTCEAFHIDRYIYVYPACAGIDRSIFPLVDPDLRLPRMRGDRPGALSVAEALGTFTPHARGSTTRLQSVFELLLVYPACAGIDLASTSLDLNRVSLPRMRGDRPVTG